MPSSASPYAAARAARAAPATNDFAYLEAETPEDGVRKENVHAVVSQTTAVDASREPTLGRSDATTAEPGDALGNDANGPLGSAGDGPDEFPVPGTPLVPTRDPPKDPKLPRSDASFSDNLNLDAGARASENTAASKAAAETARAAALVAFDVESASARAAGGGFVYAGGKGRCPSPSPASAGAKRVGGGAGPLRAFTEELGADLFFVGDSTDKLLLISGCSALLPEGERCDPAMARVGIPETTQLPHNMRPFIAEARDPLLGYSMLGDAPRPFQTRDETGCCAYASATSAEGPREDEREDVANEASCCMTSTEARTASACVAGAGAAGALHVFGPGVGPYDAAGAREDVSAYEGYGLSRSTPARVKTALVSFVKWAALRRRFAEETNASAKANGEDAARALRDDASVGTIAAPVPSRPLVVMVNSNFWPQKFWNRPVAADPVAAAADETPEQSAARARSAHGGDLEKYAADLRALVSLVGEQISDLSPAGGCVVLRTQHDMLGSDDPVRNARRVEGNARTRAINAVIETVGAEMRAPVFPWARIFNERLEQNVFDGWCHQWGDTSVYMQRRFNSWAKTHLPAECLSRSDGGAGA